MEWTSWIGRRRPVEEDALRILTIVHQLGQPAGAAGFAARIDGEDRLQRLDHLVRHPVDLAFVLMLDESDRESPALAREVRTLVQGGTENPRVSEKLHHLHLSTAWERWDHVWAYLSCRNLLSVRVDESSASRLTFLLTDEGAALLETLYLTEKNLAPYVERCRILAKHLTSRDATSAQEAALDLPSLAQELDEYRQHRRLSVEEDVLGHLFKTTFGETL